MSKKIEIVADLTDHQALELATRVGEAVRIVGVRKSGASSRTVIQLQLLDGVMLIDETGEGTPFDVSR